MSTTIAEEKARRKRSIRRRLVLGALLVGGSLYAVAFLATFTPAYESVPGDVWRSGDFQAIQRSAARATRLPRSLPSDDPRSGDPLSDAVRHAGPLSDAPPSPPIVADAATSWVTLVNKANPGAILSYDHDSFGNLYLVLGPWYDEMNVGDQQKLVDVLGRYWRAWAFEAFGSWGNEDFAPGVVIVDEQGLRAYNLNGVVSLLLPPDTAVSPSRLP